MQKITLSRGASKFGRVTRVCLDPIWSNEGSGAESPRKRIEKGGKADTKYYSEDLSFGKRQTMGPFQTPWEYEGDNGQISE